MLVDVVRVDVLDEVDVDVDVGVVEVDVVVDVDDVSPVVAPLSLAVSSPPNNPPMNCGDRSCSRLLPVTTRRSRRTLGVTAGKAGSNAALEEAAAAKRQTVKRRVDVRIFSDGQWGKLYSFVTMSSREKVDLA